MLVLVIGHKLCRGKDSPDIHDCVDPRSIGSKRGFGSIGHEDVVQAAFELFWTAHEVDQSLHIMGDREAVFCTIVSHSLSIIALSTDQTACLRR